MISVATHNLSFLIFTSDNFESNNSIKRSFTFIRGLRSNFVGGESFPESKSPDILALCETMLDDSVDVMNFSVVLF